MTLIKQLQELEKQYSALEPTQKQRHDLNQEMERFSDNFLENTETNPAYKSKQAKTEQIKLDNQTQSLTQILETYNDEVVHTGIVPASGNHMGYIPGGGIYASSLADYLAAVSNEYSGIQFASPGGVAIENECINWLKQVFSFPSSAVGNLTSGGSIANLIALTAARDKFKIKNEVIRKSVIYLSPQVHHCLHKAIRIIGLEDIQYRMIDLDKNSKIIVADLESKIQQDKAQGLNPFLVVASAGTTDTGAIDPLNEMAAVSERHGLWFHVDAAYGGFFIMVDSKKEAFKGIEKADSLVMDPHKGLFLPYGLGAVLVKDRNAVLHSHHYLANYMQDANQDSTIDSPADLSPELTKHFRGLRLWLPLKLYGKEPFIACLEHKLLLTQYFRQELKKIGFMLGPEPDLSVSYFWFPTTSEKQNQLNRKLLEHIHHDGTVFLSSTLINDQFVIRLAILVFRTSKNTIDKAIVMIKKALEKCNITFNV
jgi:glutamate/tyrosine decarboxylase-like PLP-dependent enzyme